MQNAIDNSKRLKQWTEYRIYRNKTMQLIRAAKRKYFTESISNSKDTNHIWAQLCTVNGDTKASSNHLHQELIIDNKKKNTNSEDKAHKLNSYFTSIANIINVNDSDTPALYTEKISNLVENKVPADTFFTIPLITSEQVSTYISKLESSKANGLDGFSPRVLKMTASLISPSIAMLINKCTKTGIFQLKQAKVHPIFKDGS